MELASNQSGRDLAFAFFIVSVLNVQSVSGVRKLSVAIKATSSFSLVAPIESCPPDGKSSLFEVQFLPSQSKAYALPITSRVIATKRLDFVAPKSSMDDLLSGEYIRFISSIVPLDLKSSKLKAS